MAGNRELIDESIIRDMSEGVMTIDLNGVVDSFNPAAERILGKKKDEVIGYHFARIFIGDQENDVFSQTVLDALYDPAARHEQIVSWHNEGQVRELYLVTSFLFHEGQEVGTVIVFSDITELAELKVRYAQDIEDLLDSLVKALSTAIDDSALAEDLNGQFSSQYCYEYAASVTNRFSRFFRTGNQQDLLDAFGQYISETGLFASYIGQIAAAGAAAHLKDLEQADDAVFPFMVYAAEFGDTMIFHVIQQTGDRRCIDCLKEILGKLK